MAFTLSTGLRDALAGAADIFDSGVLEIRTGAPPGPGAADSGTLLASITLPADAFGAVSSGQIALNGTWEDSSADAAGTAAHWRMKQSGDAGGADAAQERMEGTITATGGGGDMEVDNTDIAAGQSVSVSTFAVTMPAS